MIFRSVLGVCGLAAALTLASAAQSTTTPSSPAPAQPAGTPQQSAPASGQAPSGASPLQLHDLPPDAHTPTPAELQAQRHQQMMAAAMRVATLQARWGPAMSTPGVSIGLVETNRAKASDGSTQITYQITGTGFAPGEKLSLVRWPLDTHAEAVMNDVGLNAKGIAVCSPAAAAAESPKAPPASSTTPPTPKGAGTPPQAPSCTTTMKPDQPLQIQTSAAPGEALRVALIAEDRSNGAATSAVPFPIDNTDKGCKLQVLLGTKDAALVLVEGTGFPPNTSMTFDTITAGQTRPVSTRSNPEGRTVIAVLPPEGSQPSGDTTVRFGGVAPTPPSLKTPATPPPAAPNCAPSVTFHWGKDSYKVE